MTNVEMTNERHCRIDDFHIDAPCRVNHSNLRRRDILESEDASGGRFTLELLQEFEQPGRVILPEFDAHADAHVRSSNGGVYRDCCVEGLDRNVELQLCADGQGIHGLDVAAGRTEVHEGSEGVGTAVGKLDVGSAIDADALVLSALGVHIRLFRSVLSVN